MDFEYVNTLVVVAWLGAVKEETNMSRLASLYLSHFYFKSIAPR